MKNDNYYDGIASGYDELYGEEQRKKLDFIFTIINTAQLKKIESVLDVGCGSGIAQDYLKEKFDINSAGIDPSKGLLMKNKNLCLYGYAEQLPFLDEEFDLVISLTAAQNFTEPKKAFLEIKRVGKDRFIITFLKKSENSDELKNIVKETFKTVNFYEDDKDVYIIVGF